jgi:hypothetical protein
VADDVDIAELEAAVEALDVSGSDSVEAVPPAADDAGPDTAGSAGDQSDSDSGRGSGENRRGTS